MRISIFRKNTNLLLAYKESLETNGVLPSQSIFFPNFLSLLLQ